MKKARILSLFISLILVFGMLPLSASALTFSDVDYSSTLTLGETIYYTANTDNDPFINTNSWDGYAVGYTVELETNVDYYYYYVINAYSSSYLDRAIAIFPEDYDGNISDAPVYDSFYTTKTTFTLNGEFSVDTAGKYRVLIWGYCNDTTYADCELNIGKVATESYDTIDYTLNTYYNGKIDEADSFVSYDQPVYIKALRTKLQENTYYAIDFNVHADNAASINYYIAVVPANYKGAIGTYSVFEAFDTESENTVSLQDSVYISVSGEYYIYLLNCCNDVNGDPIVGDETDISIIFTSNPAYKTSFDKKLILNKTTVDSVQEEDYISTYEWDGYANGFCIDLEAGKEYEVIATREGNPEKATYTDCSVAVLPYDFDSDPSVDNIAYVEASGDAASVTKSVKFSVRRGGTYKILVWGYCTDDYYNDLFGEDISVSVTVTDKVSPDEELIVDFSETLTVGTPFEGTIDETDPYIETDAWNGYAKGFSVELIEGIEYYFSAYAECPDADYTDRAIAIFPEDITNNDIYGANYLSDSSYTGSTEAEVNFTYTPEKSGTYKILVWGYCEDAEENAIVGNSTYLNVFVDYSYEVTTINIETEAQLNLFRTDLLEGVFENDIVVNILNDLDMADYDLDDLPYFDYSIVVNGNGKTIKNLNGPLFNECYKIIVNDLDLVFDWSIAGDPETSEAVYSIGGFAGYAEYASFNSCSVVGQIEAEGVVLYEVGAFVGYAEYEIYFTDCTAYFTVISDSEVNYVGGFLGETFCSEGAFTNCHATTDITADILYNAGGLTGCIEDFVNVNSCYAIVDMSCNNGAYIGGLTGYIDEGNVFTNCYAEGKIIGTEYLGGFIGLSDCCGTNTFENCYSITDVHGISYLGGFAGTIYYDDCFYNCYTAGDLVCLSEEGNNIGTFFGIAYGNGNEFENCFAAKHNVYNTYGYLDYEINVTVESVDFNNKTEVKAMTEVLNDYVSDEYFKYLYFWYGANAKNGPDFSDIYVEEPKYLEGDVNGDGKVNMFDYIVVKSYYFNKATLTTDAQARADLNGDGKINMFDYAALKSMVMKR